MAVSFFDALHKNVRPVSVKLLQLPWNEGQRLPEMVAFVADEGLVGTRDGAEDQLTVIQVFLENLENRPGFRPLVESLPESCGSASIQPIISVVVRPGPVAGKVEDATS